MESGRRAFRSACRKVGSYLILQPRSRSRAHLTPEEHGQRRFITQKHTQVEGMELEWDLESSSPSLPLLTLLEPVLVSSSEGQICYQLSYFLASIVVFLSFLHISSCVPTVLFLCWWLYTQITLSETLWSAWRKERGLNI